MELALLAPYKCGYDVGNKNAIMKRSKFTTMAMNKSHERVRYHMSKQEYAALAARRYKTFKKQKRRESLKKKVMAFLLKLFRAIVIVLKKARLIKTRKVETVKVESVQVDDE